MMVAAALGALGCSGSPEDDYDSGVDAGRREICFPSCRLGEVCTAANRCEVMTSPFRDAGPPLDRGRD
jgi:hypothetical protein